MVNARMDHSLEEINLEDRVAATNSGGPAEDVRDIRNKTKDASRWNFFKSFVIL